MLSCGASLTVIIPTAFVSLPVQAIKRCSSRGRMRITSSGPFHNLVIWATMTLWGSLSLGPFIWSFAGFEYVGHFGRAIADINLVGIHEILPMPFCDNFDIQESPLREYIPIGSVVTKLDDTPLISPSNTNDPWDTYLTQPVIPSVNEHNLGWCVAKGWMTGKMTFSFDTRIANRSNNQPRTTLAARPNPNHPTSLASPPFPLQ